MNELDKYAEPLVADENVILKQPENITLRIANTVVFGGNQSLYISTKKFLEGARNNILSGVSHQELFQQGIKFTKIESGKKWITGKIRFCLVI